MESNSFENWLEERKDKWYMQPIIFFGIANAPIQFSDETLEKLSGDSSLWQKYRTKIQENNRYHDMMANAYYTEGRDSKAMWHSICEALSRNLHI